MPIRTIASRFNDDGVTAPTGILARARRARPEKRRDAFPDQDARFSRETRCPPRPSRYLCEVDGHGAQLPRPRRRASGIAAERSSCLRRNRCSPGGQGRGRAGSADRGEKAGSNCGLQAAHEDWAERRRSTRATRTWSGCAKRKSHPAQHDFLSGTRLPKVALPDSRITARF